MVRIAFDGFARKGEIRAREAPVPGLRQDVLGNHRDGIPLAEDARGQAEDGDKPHAQRHEAEGHNRLRGAFLEDHVSVEDEGLRRVRRGVKRGEIRRSRREGAHNVGRMRQDLWGPHSQGI